MVSCRINVFSNIADEQKTYNKFDKIICVSNIVKKSFVKLFNQIDPKKVSVKHNIIDSNEILKKSLIPNRLINNKFTICSVGRLNKQKNYLRLAKCAYRLYHNLNLDFNVWIIGEGTGRKKLEQYIKNHKMEGYFHLLGFRSNPYSIVKKANLFVCSSNAEGYSTSVVEALILGLPVVTTDCAGMKEIFGTSQCGIITKNTTEDLYQGISMVMKNIDLYKRLKNNAIRRGKDFQVANNIKDIELLF